MLPTEKSVYTGDLYWDEAMARSVLYSTEEGSFPRGSG